MKRSSFLAVCALAAASLTAPLAPLFGVDCCTTNFAGTRWALTIPGGSAGWLGVTENNGKLEGSLLWGGGNPFPVEVAAKDGVLLVTRKHKERGREITETITATPGANGSLSLAQRFTDAAGKETRRGTPFAGKLIPAHPPRPDLSKLVFGTPVKLIGDTLDGDWVAMNKRAFNGWSLKDGVLSNRVVDANGKVKHGTNLRTSIENFEDFNLKTEVNMAPKGNSGIYLRGIYEIQMADTYGKPLNNLNMGALYGRIVPSVAAEKPAGEWQTVDITLVDRHVTVILNGQKIIDNQPVQGCTGGALTSDEFRAGPIYLQGDHTNVSYRNMVLTPVVKAK